MHAFPEVNPVEINVILSQASVHSIAAPMIDSPMLIFSFPELKQLQYSSEVREQKFHD